MEGSRPWWVPGREAGGTGGNSGHLGSFLGNLGRFLPGGGPSTTVTFEEDLLFLPSMGFRMGSQQTLILVTPLSGFSFPTSETWRASQPLVHDMYVTGQISWAVQRSWFPTPWPHLPFSRRGLRALDLLTGHAPGPRCLGRYGAGNGETQPAPG